MNNYTIAIDGHSACGKSTLAKALAEQLRYQYIDTGAMYRAVTLYFIRHHIDITNNEDISNALDKIDIRFDRNEHGAQITYLNNKPVSEEIRTIEVSDMVSEVAALSLVRKKLVHSQQEMGKYGGIVMDGRDIGTVVFPHAEFKFFVTASKEIRVQRRYEELTKKGIVVSKSIILKNLEKRDFIDSNRKDSPLRQADDAILLDNSEMNKKDQLEFVLQIINKMAS